MQIQKNYKEIIQVFSKLGMTAFGGPAAHIAMMEDEIVTKRKWISKAEFVDLIGFTNLIPGPNSTELAIVLGYRKGGKIGLFLAGTFFILPAMLLVLILAMFYSRYGDVPYIESIFNGIKPVILAVVVQSLYRLSKSTIHTTVSLFVFLMALLLAFLGVNEITNLLVMAGIMFLIRYSEKIRPRHLAIEPMTLGLVFLTFLKIGSFLYGSGYVLLAFIQSEFVDRYDAITMEQLLDAVAIGQFTPGPVFTTATFVGYLVQGIPGAILGTIAIFLPSFLMILFLYPFFPKLRSSKVFSILLDGVTVASLALMAHVTFQLATTSLFSWATIILFILSFLSLVKYKINSTFLIIFGGMIGFFFNLA